MRRALLVVGMAAALGVVGVARGDAPPLSPPDPEVLQVVGEILRLMSGIGVVPQWAVILLALVVVTAIVLVRRYHPIAAIGRGIASAGRAVVRYAKSLPTSNPGPPEPPGGGLPPMDMPPGGIPIPPKDWKDGEP